MLLNNFRRKQGATDYWNSISVGMAAELLVVFVVPLVVGEEGLPIRGYGLFLMLAILAAGLLIIYRGKRLWNIPPELLLSVEVVSVIFGILGARLFYVIEYWNNIKGDSFGSTFFNIFNMVNGGLVVYGSIIGGTVALFVYLYLKKLPILATFDLYAPALLLGIALGRLGCLMNGCCFGAICDGPMGITFPPGSPAHLRQLEHGNAPLAGFYLRTPEASAPQKEQTLLGIKPKEFSVWTETVAPVIIERVESGSPAFEAGLRPGMRIRELALLGSKSSLLPGAQQNLQFYNVVHNAGVFQFFFNAMMKHADSHVLMVCEETKTESPTETATAGAGTATAGTVKTATAATAGTIESIDGTFRRNIIFHPDYLTVHPVWPTQIISSVTAGILCLLLLFLSRFCRRDGELFAIMLLLYAVNRFCLELLRVDEDSFMGTGLSISQCVSIVTFLLAGGLLFYLLKYGSPKRAWSGRFPAEQK